MFKSQFKMIWLEATKELFLDLTGEVFFRMESSVLRPLT